MANKRKRSFRLSEVQADVVKFALLFLLADSNQSKEPLFNAYHEAAQKLYSKLENYEWEIES